MEYSEGLVLVLAFVLVAGLGLALMIMGKVWKTPHYTFFGGLIWLFGAVAVCPDLGIGWVLLSLALGLMLMYEGAVGIVEG